MTPPDGAATDAGRTVLERFRHIAIEGPIGVGKTTLANRLAAHLGAEALHERPLENPFLDRFYADMSGYAFQTQLAFLFQRVKQMQGLAQRSMFTPNVVSDFMFEKDAIFARLTLDDDEYDLYRGMYRQVAPQIAPPDLVVWLHAPAAVLLRRIRTRGIAMEQRIPADYLERLADGYAAHFASGGAGRTPVLAVATERFDPAHDDADLAVLLARMAAVRGGVEALVPD